MSDASDRISELFAVGSRDLTPAPARHSAHVLYAPVSRDAEVSSHCASVLSAAELQRRDRLAAKCDKARFEQRRAFRRICGAAALGSLLNRSANAAPTNTITPPHITGGAPPALPHWAPKAKRVIYLFQNGAPTHVDLYDYKPKLKEMHGKQIPDSVAADAFRVIVARTPCFCRF